MVFLTALYSEIHLLPKYPSCLQTTAASMSSHSSEHTVPHSWSAQISTRPVVGVTPPTKRTSPSLHISVQGRIQARGGRRHYGSITFCPTGFKLWQWQMWGNGTYHLLVSKSCMVCHFCVLLFLFTYIAV